MTLPLCRFKREVRAKLARCYHFSKTVWPSLVGERSVLRWFYYGIWKTKLHSFAGLGEMVSDLEVLTSSPLRLGQVRSLKSSLI